MTERSERTWILLYTGLHFLCYVRFHWILCCAQACISCVMWGFTEYYVTHRPAFPMLCEVSLNIMLLTGLHFLCYVRFHWISCYTQACTSCVMWDFTEYHVTHRPAFPVLCEVSLNFMLPTGLHFLCYVRFHWISCYTQACISCVMWGFTESTISTIMLLDNIFCQIWRWTIEFTFDAYTALCKIPYECLR